nr:PREDICTED: uncharacterized protein LOC109031477 [Bemisia tabaci]
MGALIKPRAPGQFVSREREWLAGAGRLSSRDRRECGVIARASFRSVALRQCVCPFPGPIPSVRCRESCLNYRFHGLPQSGNTGKLEMPLVTQRYELLLALSQFFRFYAKISPSLNR